MSQHQMVVGGSKSTGHDSRTGSTVTPPTRAELEKEQLYGVTLWNVYETLDGLAASNKGDQDVIGDPTRKLQNSRLRLDRAMIFATLQRLLQLGCIRLEDAWSKIRLLPLREPDEKDAISIDDGSDPASDPDMADAPLSDETDETSEDGPEEDSESEGAEEPSDVESAGPDEEPDEDADDDPTDPPPSEPTEPPSPDERADQPPSTPAPEPDVAPEQPPMEKGDSVPTPTALAQAMRGLSGQLRSVAKILGELIPLEKLLIAELQENSPPMPAPAIGAYAEEGAADLMEQVAALLQLLREQGKQQGADQPFTASNGEAPDWARRLAHALMTNHATMNVILKRVAPELADNRTPEELETSGFPRARDWNLEATKQPVEARPIPTRAVPSAKPAGSGQAQTEANVALASLAQTDREQAALTALREGKKLADLARTLDVRYQTVSYHLVKLAKRAGLSSVKELRAWVQQQTDAAPGQPAPEPEPVAPPAGDAAAPPLVSLAKTEVQRRILAGILEGKNNTVIAGALDLHPTTVRYHALQLAERAGVSSRDALIEWTRQQMAGSEEAVPTSPPPEKPAAGTLKSRGASQPAAAKPVRKATRARVTPPAREATPPTGSKARGKKWLTLDEVGMLERQASTLAGKRRSLTPAAYKQIETKSVGGETCYASKMVRDFLGL